MRQSFDLYTVSNDSFDNHWKLSIIKIIIPQQSEEKKSNNYPEENMSEAVESLELKK